MATGGFKSNATTDFLEEWKAKREKMRAKMLGDIAAATGIAAGAPPGTGTGTGTSSNKSETRELNNNNNNCASPCPAPRSASSTVLKTPEEAEPQPGPANPPGSNPKKTQPPQFPCPPQQDSSPMAAGNDSDKESSGLSPSPGKGKEKKSTGPSARKGKGQIEKRKLREKRRSTGVVSIPSNESLDELDDDDGGEKEREREQKLVQANTFQNEAMTTDQGSGHLVQETQRSGSSRHKSSSGPGSAEEEVAGNSRHRHTRHGRDGSASSGSGSLERRMEELEKELARECQENARLLKAHQDKDDLIGKLKEEIDLLNRDLDDIEDENEQLKQENKTLLKVVGQLTR